MPSAIAWGVSLIGAELTSAFLMMYATEISTAAVILGGLAYSSAKAKQAKQQAKDQFNAAQVDRMVNVVSNVAPRELVLGRVRKGGTVFYKASTGSANRDLYLAIALAGHEIDAVEQIYFNDAPVSLDANGMVTDDQYSGHAHVYTHLGGPDQVADAHLTAAFPTDWPATNTVTGVAYLVVHLSYSETAFPSGVPNITAVLRGAKLFDPRTGLTTWSDNPALMMRHVYAHPKFGKATPSAAEDARFMAAANVCDQSVQYTVGGVAQSTCALYRAGIVAPYGTQAKSLLDDLSQAMGGSWAFAGGQLYLKPGVYTAPVMHLTDADLAVVQRNGAQESQKPISIGVHKERAQKFNTVKATIWDAAADYKQTVLSDLVGAALVTRDGAPLVQDITLPAVGYAPQALHIAGIMMRDARDALVLDIPVKLRAYPLELFDTISLTLSRYGWAAKTFMLLGRTWNADGSIQLTLKETAAAITQMDSDFIPQGYTPNTNLPQPWRVAAVGPLTITSGPDEMLVQEDGSIISRMRVSWPQVQDAAVVQHGQVEVQYRAQDSTGAWETLATSGNETTVVTSDVQPGTIYTVRARARTSIAIGQWSATATSGITGKSAAPAAVSAATATGGMFQVLLSWVFGDTTATDLLGTEIWWSATNDRAAAARLSYEPYPTATYAHIGLSAGQGGYYWLRVGNTSGIKSAWYPTSATAGLYAVASTDTSALLAQLHNAVGVDQLAAALSQPIGLIPGLSLDMTELKGTTLPAVGARIDAAESHMTDGFAAESSAWSALNAWAANVVGGFATNFASIESIETTKIGYATLDATGETFDNSGAIKTAADVTTWNTANPTNQATWHIGLPLAQAIKNVSIATSEGTASLQQKFIAQALVNGDLSAQYVLKVDTNGHVTGIALASGVDGGSMTVLADKFLIVKPDGTGTPLPMLTLATVNGVTALGLDGNLIVDGSIVARSLAASSITADKIATGTLTAAQIAAGTLTATQIAAGTLTADKMAAGTITAASGVIADAAITSAQIGDAEVSTLKLAGNSVSVMSAAESSSDASTTLYVPAGQVMRVVGIGYFAKYEYAYGALGYYTPSVTIDGITASGHVYSTTIADGGGTLYVASFSTLINYVDVDGGTSGRTVTISIGGTYNNSVGLNKVIALGTLR